jgi:L-lysine 6-oxidase
MSKKYAIHPRIGVARVGNSPTDFYLAPESIGGLPLACDAAGNPLSPPEFVSTFKDSLGRVKRQAAKFRIFESDESGEREINLQSPGVEKISWTVHIANKKPIWYTFSELQGDLEFGRDNSYSNQHIPLNNPDVSGNARKNLMIDPGPRSIETPGAVNKISRYNIPADYQYGSFPPVSAGGQQIDDLGELRMDHQGNLLALGGNGNVTGSATISSFRGAGGYWDDVGDGFVLATIHFKDGSQVEVDSAWLVVGSPKFAPQLVNITTMWDVMFDVALRFKSLDPAIYSGKDTWHDFPQHNGYTPLHGFNPDYVVNFETQVQPILDRIAAYRWVADIPYLTDVANPGFDLRDASEHNAARRKEFYSLFRVPVLPADYSEWIAKVENGPNFLFSSAGIPLLPLNSGDNSVTNQGPIYKFETLSATQYFFLNQWAEGKFDVGRPIPLSFSEQLDQAGGGSCAGAPLSPGIEMTWITRNANLYAGLAHFKLAHYFGDYQQLNVYYSENGLSTTADEAEGAGCEPGDLTKRMAIPWQSDFQECTVQTPNITNQTINQFADGTGIEAPPAYYVYWWPPQSPMHVITGSVDAGNQVMDALVSQIDGQPIIPAGQRVPYQRGINTIADMINSWSRLGFILNQSKLPSMPYFVEKERNTQELAQITILQQATK